VNHQSIARDLSVEDYNKASKLIEHTSVRVNGYYQYQIWGSISHPFPTVLQFILNWAFWFCVFYLIGGMPLAVALFGMSAVWAVGIRTFNFDGHGRGKDKRRAGEDFNYGDLSINQPWPGMITGEWHNNHHLYPNGIRAGFLPHQWDYAWLFICLCRFLGGVGNCRDFYSPFMEKHYKPYLARKKATEVVERVPV
jgi:stearoyl-CoA desaturase (delta-9 desaturase)